MELVFTRAHTKDLATLKSLVSERVAHWATRYPQLDLASHYRWRDDRTATGAYRGGEGTVTLGEREVRVTLELPFFARPFKAKIEGFVNRELDDALRA